MRRRPAPTRTDPDEKRVESVPESARDETEPFGYSTVVFRDPDNLRLELLALP
ncbi:hypothetical protein [Streptomyces sp. NPDC047990]|uniref:hypothetical protein n=1 Tax=Streptomyces sp. NPDC047990 TaxID=3365496 RepID=UPI003717D884